MPKRYAGLKDELAFMIASIQQATSFPETEHRRTRPAIDLPIRQGFARHTLVGLNAFLILLAQQFPNVLGIRVQDPMLTTSNGIAPLATAYQVILEQAEHATATWPSPRLHHGAGTGCHSHIRPRSSISILTLNATYQTNTIG
jgi:hypothetical protein